MSILTINGVSDDDLGLVATSIGAAWSTPGLSRPATSVMGRHGSVPGLIATGREKRVPISFKLDGTVSTRRANFNALMRHLRGMLVLEWSDAPGLFQRARLDQEEARALFEAQAYVHGPLNIGLEFILDQPIFEDKVPSIIGVSSTAALLSGLGTEPSEGLFRFAGATTDLTLTYKHGLTRETITTLTLSGSSGAGTVLFINVPSQEIWTWDTTTGEEDFTAIDDLYSSGDFPVFDPGDGDENLPPTIESNHTGTVRYRGAYA